MRITNVLFTYSWGGYVVRRENGRQDTLTPTALLAEVGEAEYHRLSRIAHRMTGHWHAV